MSSHCTVEIGFEATTYNTSENESTVEVCANLVSENITGCNFEVEFMTSPESGLGGKLAKCNITYCTLIVP